jgi:endonuclease/exonuclease/phosphatase family metal-dependent hydrolase
VPARVVSYNIRHGRGMDDRVDLERTAAVLRSLAPDLVGLQEVDDRVTRSGGVAQADSLGRLLGMHSAFGSFFDYQGGRYGLALLSRYPIRRTHELRLPDGNEPRIALIADVEMPGGNAIRVINVHFDWVANDTFVSPSAPPHVRDRYALGALDPARRLQRRARLANVDLFRRARWRPSKPAQDRFTFSSTDPVKEIDFVFAAPAARWRARGVRVVDEPAASTIAPLSPNWYSYRAAPGRDGTVSDRPSAGTVAGAAPRRQAWPAAPRGARTRGSGVEPATAEPFMDEDRSRRPNGACRRSRNPTLDGLAQLGDHPLIGVTPSRASRGSRATFAPRTRAERRASQRAEVRAGRNCAQVVGRWDWLSTGGVVAIAEGGFIRWYRVATDPLPTINGTWECREGARAHLTFTWIETKLVDTLVLADDGQRLTGANTQTGFRLSGTRAR